MKFNELISELKRRHVFKSTIAYLAISWVVIQIASTILPTFDAPDYVLQGLIYVLSIGLIFWIGFSWMYDLTADGIQKTEGVGVDEEKSSKASPLAAISTSAGTRNIRASRWSTSIRKQTRNTYHTS